MFSIWSQNRGKATLRRGEFAGEDPLAEDAGDQGSSVARWWVLVAFAARGEEKIAGIFDNRIRVVVGIHLQVTADAVNAVGERLVVVSHDVSNRRGTLARSHRLCTAARPARSRSSLPLASSRTNDNPAELGFEERLGGLVLPDLNIVGLDRAVDAGVLRDVERT